MTEAKVLIAVPTRKNPSYIWTNRFVDICRNVPPGAGRTWMPGAHPIDGKRENVAVTAMTEGYSHVFYLDDDVLPPPDVIPRLLKHNAPIVAGLACGRAPPFLPAVSTNAETEEAIRTFTPDSVMEVERVGAACLLVSVEVFRALRRPWFRFTIGRGYLEVDSQGGAVPETTEDWYFCQHAREGGFRILVDTSILCEHLTTFRLVPSPEGTRLLPEPEYRSGEIAIRRGP